MCCFYSSCDGEDQVMGKIEIQRNSQSTVFKPSFVSGLPLDSIPHFYGEGVLMISGLGNDI